MRACGTLRSRLPVTGTADTLKRYFARRRSAALDPKAVRPKKHGRENPAGDRMIESGEQREMNNNVDTQTWCEWQQAVVKLIREDFSEVLTQVGEEDVDWDAWRPLYEQGLSPRDAVADAFLLLPA